MPAIAGTAGQTSSIRIKGSIDITDIDTGFSRISTGFEGVKGRVKGLGSDMTRMSLSVASLAKKFSLLSLAGVGAITALASRAPAVAPALAKIKLATFKLTNALGTALAPAFERVAGWLDRLSTWVGNNSERIGAVANKFLDWAEAIGVKLWPYLEKVGNWALDHPKLFAGIVAGLALSPAIITGIGILTGLINLLTGAVISPSILALFGKAGLIAGGAVVGGKILQTVTEGQRERVEAVFGEDVFGRKSAEEALNVWADVFRLVGKKTVEEDRNFLFSNK